MSAGAQKPVAVATIFLCSPGRCLFLYARRAWDFLRSNPCLANKLRSESGQNDSCHVLTIYGISAEGLCDEVSAFNTTDFDAYSLVSLCPGQKDINAQHSRHH